MSSEKFICPACNSRDEAGHALTNPIPPNIVTELAICHECDSHIPSHIADRWKRMSITRARENGGNTNALENARVV